MCVQGHDINPGQRFEIEVIVKVIQFRSRWTLSAYYRKPPKLKSMVILDKFINSVIPKDAGSPILFSNGKFIHYPSMMLEFSTFKQCAF